MPIVDPEQERKWMAWAGLRKAVVDGLPLLAGSVRSTPLRELPLEWLPKTSTSSRDGQTAERFALVSAIE